MEVDRLRDEVFAPWISSCVSYESIQQDMADHHQRGWTKNDEANFQRKLQEEVKKVFDFIAHKEKEFDSKIAYCERALGPRTKVMALSDIIFDRVDEDLTNMLVELKELDLFTRYNFKAVEQLFEDLGRYSRQPQRANFVNLLRAGREPLDNQRFDPLLVKISALHDICQLRGKTREGNASAGFDQNAFERATAKYWIHPDNVNEVKASIVFHLPLLRFDKDKPFDLDEEAISSVYLDNDRFDLYSGRLQRDEGAEAIRLRWYGPMDTPNVFVERKTHHASWLDGASVKDRVRLNSNQIGDYLSSKYSAEKYKDELQRSGTDAKVVKDNYFIASGVQTSVQTKELGPVMRVYYDRTAYQVPGDQRLRISIDSNLTFVREDTLDGVKRRQSEQWRRPDMGIDHPFHNLPADDVYHFPYAVLETKLQTHLGQEPPQWLTELLDSNLVYEVPRFSKYLHGAAHFWKPSLPLLPWWLDQMTLDIRISKPDNNYKALSRSKSLKPLIGGRYRPGYLVSQLEKRSTIKRKPSTATRKVSIRRAPSSSRSSPSKPSTDNPFEDPFWNSGSSTPTPISYGQRFPYTNSRECLLTGDRGMTPTPRSSVQQTGNEKSGSQIELLERKAPSAGDMEKGTTERSLRKPTGFFGRFYKLITVDRDLSNKMSAKRKGAVGGRIEPKLHFANERTFIHYLHFSALILTAALTLVNFGDATARYTGAAFFAIALLLAVYGYYIKQWRAKRITNNPTGRYDDAYGPILLCIFVVGALVVNLTLRILRPPESSTYLGIDGETQQQSN